MSEKSIKPDPKKLSAIEDYPRPTNQKQIKQWIALAGYYRKFVNNFTKIAQPLTKLLQKNEEYIWDEKAETTFQELKNQLLSAPVLQFPDFTKDFCIRTDASGIAVGGILSQFIKDDDSL